jgi:hypothetical protein
MNDLTQQNNSLIQKNEVLSEDQIEFVIIKRKISYEDFNWEKWINKLLKIKLEGNFPIKIGSALSYKREKVTYIGILLGVDINNRIFGMLDKNGSNNIYIPFDGTLEVYEGRVKI